MGPATAMADEKLNKEEPLQEVSDEASTETSHVPGGDEGDALENDPGVVDEEVHEEEVHEEAQGEGTPGEEVHNADEGTPPSDDGVHGFAHEEDGEPVAAQPDEPVGPLKSWYIIHAYSGFENKVAESLRTRSQAFGFADRLGQILIPTEEVIELRNGKKVTSKRMLYPGYVLVEMEMDDELWHAVKSTPRVTGFVGGGTKPVPLTADEVNSVLYRQASSAERPRPKMTFEKNETVKIVDGPFTNFSGKVDEINSDRNTLRVMVTIFGRSTPVELDFLQVEKI